jgi:hypothetical protein
MQAASLFAFARARGAAVAIVALVSNCVDQVTGHFDTGGNGFRVDVLAAGTRPALPQRQSTVIEHRHDNHVERGRAHETEQNHDRQARAKLASARRNGTLWLPSEKKCANC